MTMPMFLDASYALFAEERQRIEPLVTLQQIREILEPTDEPQTYSRAVQKQSVAKQNQDSASALMAMMGGVANAPVVKGV